MYWEFSVLARKLGIVAVAVGLANTNAYQLAMLLLVLFIAFVAQVPPLLPASPSRQSVFILLRISGMTG
jgi:hypothetical protein